MRGKIIIATMALAVVVGMSVAYAAAPYNKYTAKLTFTSSKPGTKKKPVNIGYTENLSAASTQAGHVAAPLVDIKTTIYGLQSNLKYFPTCSATTIDNPANKYNAGCKKGSEVATGAVVSEIGPPTLLAPGVSCKPDLAVYNGGKGTEWFFFTTSSATQCGGLTTGQTQAYPGKLTQSGKNLVIDVPLPSFVSTAVAHHTGLYGSLSHETLVIKPLSTKHKGKTVFATQSVACKGKTRPYSVAYTAVQSASGPKQTSTVTGSAKC